MITVTSSTPKIPQELVMMELKSQGNTKCCPSVGFKPFAARYGNNRFKSVLLGGQIIVIGSKMNV